MADVRLTATNPEDSSVVPVACDASGRLLLQDPEVVEGPQGPQGPPGPEGPPGPKGEDGDPFSGNFAGDVTFDSGASFAGGKSIIGDDGSAQFANGKFDIYNSGNLVSEGFWTLDGKLTINRNSNSQVLDMGTGDTVNCTFISSDGVNSAGGIYIGQNLTSLSLDTNTRIACDGSVFFAGNKAGITAEGYLWCTTRRGDTVVLDSTSNGVGIWEEYTPSTKIEIWDELNAIRPDSGETPADTQ